MRCRLQATVKIKKGLDKPGSRPYNIIRKRKRRFRISQGGML